MAFKGFENLIEACAMLHAEASRFRCEIIGDGPLRESLQQRIDDAQLESRVMLRGSLTQAQFSKHYKRSDIFALASIVDGSGASDVFPTVILEAMASARPVVSTSLAGIPETVVWGDRISCPARRCLGPGRRVWKNCFRSRELRAQFGAAGKARIEKNFQIETTICPLLDLFAKLKRKSTTRSHAEPVENKIAYLIDLWPDERLPMLEKELLEMERRNSCDRFGLSNSARAAFQWLDETTGAATSSFSPTRWRSKRNGGNEPELAHHLKMIARQKRDRAPVDLFCSRHVLRSLCAK